MRTQDNRLCGEDHPRARVSDAVVHALRDAYETEQPRPSITVLARRFRLPRSTTGDIVLYRTRTLTRIPCPDDLS